MTGHEPSSSGFLSFATAPELTSSLHPTQLFPEDPATPSQATRLKHHIRIPERVRCSHSVPATCSWRPKVQTSVSGRRSIVWHDDATFPRFAQSFVRAPCSLRGGHGVARGAVVRTLAYLDCGGRRRRLYERRGGLIFSKTLRRQATDEYQS